MITRILSGGALGADSVWSFLAEKAGVDSKNIYHIIASGMKRPTGGLDDDRIREQQSGTTITISDELMRKGVEALLDLDINILGKPAKEYFNGFNGNARFLSVGQKLQVRNYYQIRKADNVYAVTELKNGRPNGGTSTAINIAIAMEKPVFILDPYKGQWYEFVQGSYEPRNNIQLEGICACIGTRSLVKYKQCKYGNWVDAPYVGEANEKRTREMMMEAIRGARA